MNTLVIDRSIQMEANIEAGTTLSYGQKIYFRDIPFLTNRLFVVYGIEAYSSTDQQRSTFNNPVIAQAGLAEAVLTLMQDNDEMLQSIPLRTLNRSLNGGIVQLINNMNVNINKSYVQIVSNAPTVTAGQSFLFDLYYTFVDQKVAA